MHSAFWNFVVDLPLSLVVGKIVAGRIGCLTLVVGVFFIMSDVVTGVCVTQNRLVYASSISHVVPGLLPSEKDMKRRFGL